MTTPSVEADQEWVAKLAAASEEEREALMKTRYMDLASLDEEERRARLRAMTLAEYTLSDDELRPITRSRLRVWLSMDPEMARKVAGSLEAIMAEVPGSIAWRRVALVQTMARELSVEDAARLREIIPGAFADRLAAVTGLASRTTAERTSTRTATTAPRKKPWWAFWKKG